MNVYNGCNMVEIKPKIYEEAAKSADWITVMQEEMYDFEEPNMTTNG